MMTTRRGDFTSPVRAETFLNGPYESNHDPGTVLSSPYRRRSVPR